MPRIVRLPLAHTGAGSTPRRRGRSGSQGPPITPSKYNESLSQNPHDGYESDTSYVGSSPISGTKAQQAAIRKEKKRKTQQAALLEHYRARRERNSWREMNTHQPGHLDGADPPGPSRNLAAEPAIPIPMVSQSLPDQADAVFKDILARLQDAGHTWGDLVEWIADPLSTCPAHTRYRGFFKSSKQVSRVLNHWASKRNCKSGQKALRKWAVEHVSKEMAREGDEVTKSNLLQSHTMQLDKSFVSNFSFVGLYRKLSMLCPVTTTLFHTLATTPRQELSKTEQTEQRKQHVSTYRNYALVTKLIGTAPL